MNLPSFLSRFVFLYLERRSAGVGRDFFLKRHILGILVENGKIKRRMPSEGEKNQDLLLKFA